MCSSTPTVDTSNTLHILTLYLVSSSSVKELTILMVGLSTTLPKGPNPLIVIMGRRSYESILLILYWFIVLILRSRFCHPSHQTKRNVLWGMVSPVRIVIRLKTKLDSIWWMECTHPLRNWFDRFFWNIVHSSNRT